MSLLAALFAPAFLRKLVFYVIAFAFGGLIGNFHATKAALIEREELGAKTMAKNHEILFTEFKKQNTELKAAVAQARAADTAAYAVMQKGMADAERAGRVAERALNAALAKEKETVDGLRNVNEILASEMRPNPGCVLSPGVRLSLNDYIDSINNRPNAGPPKAASTLLAPGSHSADQPLACADLAASVRDILEHDAMLTAWVLSWQAWSTEALK